MCNTHVQNLTFRVFFKFNSRRKYIPALKNFPTKYIHEPWTASESVQKVAKCLIGKDYPLPMVNHVVASRNNMERMKQVYQQLAKYRQGREECNFNEKNLNIFQT
jgi:cryptochrome